jgi:hypothetical protein
MTVWYVVRTDLPGRDVWVTDWPLEGDTILSTHSSREDAAQAFLGLVGATDTHHWRRP